MLLLIDANAIILKYKTSLRMWSFWIISVSDNFPPVKIFYRSALMEFSSLILSNVYLEAVFGVMR